MRTSSIIDYEYEEGRIVRATESDITLNGEIVTSKVIVNNVKYYYDTEGKMTKKVITFSDNSTHTVHYENSDDNTIVKFDVPDPENTNKKQTITSHSKTDSFGRKIFDELQIGRGFVSRQFSYMPGAITEAHKENRKIKSTATTQLVSQIALSDGRTISYEYDDEERITKVTDTIDGTVSYTYDALGQLETETKDGVTTKFEYDNYGNITAKGEVDESGEIASATKISYEYGNGTWRDLLTSYNGQTITYDAQGNPTSYLGHTLTWEKERQLKKFDNIEYTYNANGIRTSKKVNGILHTYTLDGTKILREVWDGNTLIPLYDNEDSVCGILYNNVPYYFIKNLQGDVIAIVDKDAQTVARYSYDAWGVPKIKLDSSDCQIATINPFRYRGYYYDEEIGLYYLQSRYYDVTLGRFVNADNTSVAFFFDSLNFNLFAYCDNSMTNDFDSSGYASFRTRNNTLNKFVEALEKSIPNLYTQDFWCKEKQLLRIGTTNLALTISCGIAAQTNKNALFGGMFKRGTLEVSAFFGISNYVCFSFSAGITWRKAYIKIGLLLAMSRGWSGFYGGAYVEISVPTWLLAVATVAVGVACVYNPAVAAYIAKIIASIRSTARAAAAALVPIFPHIVKAAA